MAGAMPAIMLIRTAPTLNRLGGTRVGVLTGLGAWLACGSAARYDFRFASHAAAAVRGERRSFLSVVRRAASARRVRSIVFAIAG